MSREYPLPITRREHYLKAIADRAESSALGNKMGALIDTATGSIVSFVPDSTVPTVRGLTVNVEPVQSGSGDPSPDNIRPISGWDATKVYDDPKYGGTVAWNQLYNPTIVSPTTTANGITFTKNEDGSISVSGTATATTTLQLVGALTVVANHKMLVKGSPRGGGSNTYNIATSGYADYGNGIIFNNASNVRYVWICIVNGMTITTPIVFRPQIFDLTEMFGAGNEPSTVEEFKALFPKDFYPYDDSYTETCVSAVNSDPYLHYTIQLGQTVYGGKLNVTGGKMVVDRAEVDLTVGMSGGTAGSSYVFFKTLSNPKTVPNSQIASIISDAYTAIRFNGVASNINTIAIRDNGVMYVNTGSAEIQPVGHAVYELATPITIDLTPIEISVLTGQTNNIWADSGDVSVDYAADLKTYIDNKIATAASSPIVGVATVGTAVVE